MCKELCFNIEGVNIYLEQVLVDYVNVPIFFLCSGEKQYYLALCTDIEELNYIVVKLSLEDTYNLLHGNITMRKAILKQPEYWDIVSGEEISLDTVEKKNINTIKMDLLPEEGACFEILTNQIKKFVQNFDNEIVKSSIQLDIGELMGCSYDDTDYFSELLACSVPSTQISQVLLYDEEMCTIVETEFMFNTFEKIEQNNGAFAMTESYAGNRADAA